MFQELALLQDSIHTLKMAQSKFQESKKSIEKAQNYKASQPLLVPLTGSVSLNKNRNNLIVILSSLSVILPRLFSYI